MGGELSARLTAPVGTRAWLRVYWGDDCPSCGGGDARGYHNAQVLLGDTGVVRDWHFMGEPSDYQHDPRWPSRCDHCAAAVPPEATRQVFRRTLYDTPSGDLEPGCLFWADWFREHDGVEAVPSTCVFHQSGCDGRHLMAVLPNGRQWDIDGRASNCTMPADRVHRCWVRHGDPPRVTVDKCGITCAAGGGSIQSGDYHGFLRDGVFT